MVIDADLLPPGSVVEDEEPPGHISLVGLNWETAWKAVIDRGKIPK